MVRVRLLANLPPLFAGEFAGFEEDYADLLVQRGVAVYVEDQPQLQTLDVAALQAEAETVAQAQAEAAAEVDPAPIDPQA